MYMYIYVSGFQKSLLVIRCDTANYKPALRGAESISEETLFLKTCYMLVLTAVRLHAPPLELTDGYQGVSS